MIDDLENIKNWLLTNGKAERRGEVASIGGLVQEYSGTPEMGLGLGNWTYLLCVLVVRTYGKSAIVDLYIVSTRVIEIYRGSKI